MPTLPVMSGREVVAVLESFGWRIARKRGIHIMMTKSGRAETLSVPDHHELSKGTLRSLIRKAGLAVEESLAAI